MIKCIFLVGLMGCVGLSLPSVAQASFTLSIGDAYYVGSVFKGVPSGIAFERDYINTLTGLAPGALPVTIDGQEYVRSSLAGPFDAAVESGSLKIDGLTKDDNEITLNQSFQYVLAKYGNNPSLVWYNAAGFTGHIEVPGMNNLKDDGGELSHIAFFNPKEGVIPEPTMLLVWSGLAGLALQVRRRRV